MKKDDRVYILHIRDSIDKIIRYTRDFKKSDFMNNEMAQDAVVRQFEIIGEASKNISEEFKNNYDEVPWKRMIGMRNKVIHEYFGVQLDIVWETIVSDLPELKTSINKLISDFTNDTPLGI